MSPLPTSAMRAHPNCLPVGTRIAEFEVTGLVGEGGFGIVYLARDTALQRDVALKEFMPSALAGRVDGIRVAVRSPDHQAKFDAGLKGFVKEARLLAKFSHPSLVKVYRLLEGNATAYMAMQFYAGQTLAQRMLHRGVTFDEAAIARITVPLFSGLEMLHQSQVFHRDIAPDNIMLTQAGSVLLDFGSARHIIGEGVQALTAVLKPSYSPVEQYVTDGTMRQGAWTDVYALGAVMYHMATGRPPVQAVSRLMTDSMPTIREVKGDAFSERFSDAVAQAMSVAVENRLQSIQALRGALGWQTLAPMATVAPVATGAVTNQPPMLKPTDAAKPLPTVALLSTSVRSWIVGGCVAAVVFGVVLAYLMR